MLIAVGEQQRMLAHDGAEDAVALTGVELVGIAGEDLLDVLGPSQHDEGTTGRRHPDREDVAVAPVQPRNEPMPVAEDQEGLDRERQPRAARHQIARDRRRRLAGQRPHPGQPLLDLPLRVGDRHAVAGSRSRGESSSGAATSRAARPHAYAPVSTRKVSHQYENVNPGQIVRFTPLESRYQLVQPPVVQMPLRSLSWMRRWKASCAGFETSTVRTARRSISSSSRTTYFACCSIMKTT